MFIKGKKTKDIKEKILNNKKEFKEEEIEVLNIMKKK